ncbi:MAG: nucleoside hydrolase, partial [Thermoguttaceae bacterium]|nr:nucleoside hydrolase [Thermoguttaceae bacterium]
NTDRYPSATLAQKNADGSPEFPGPEGFTPEEPIALLRRLLANAPDRSVVVIQVGFSTNLAALLDTPGDDVSPLSGKELVAQKVRLLSVMGGSFAPDPSQKYYVELAEWNIKNDVPSARKLVEEWPTEIVFSGAEVGDAVRMSPTNLKYDYRSPKAKFLRDSFAHWASVAAPDEGLNHRRPTWDVTSVLFVLRPEEGRGYYRLSEPLDVSFDDDGVTRFKPNPESKRRIFLLDDEAKIRVSEAIVNLCSQP